MKKFGRSQAFRYNRVWLYTVKLGYNDHGYNEFTAITNKIDWYFWSQMGTSLHKPSRL